MEPSTKERAFRDEHSRRGSRCCDKSPQTWRCAAWIAVVGVGIILLTGGCSNESQVQKSGGAFSSESHAQICVDSSKRLSAEEIRGLSDEQLNRAMMSPFSESTYVQSRQRKWVAEARAADKVLVKNERTPSWPR